jgi:hypothetical protein
MEYLVPYHSGLPLSGWLRVAEGAESHGLIIPLIIQAI